MAKQPNPEIRNDNLRLILSNQEAAYIDHGLNEARLGLRQILIVGGLAACAAAGVSAYKVLGDASPSMDYPVVIVLVVSFTTLAICTVNGLGAYFSLRRFRSYRDDHEKFLRHYRRGR